MSKLDIWTIVGAVAAVAVLVLLVLFGSSRVLANEIEDPECWVEGELWVTNEEGEIFDKLSLFPIPIEDCRDDLIEVGIRIERTPKPI